MTRPKEASLFQHVPEVIALPPVGGTVSGGRKPQDVLREEWLSALSDRGRVNILIAGITGVGKSTLINAVFGQHFAHTGQGRPVSQGLEEISNPSHAFTLFDSKGFELKDIDEIIESQSSFIKEKQNSDDPSKHIHMAWYCIGEYSRRVQQSESEYLKLLARHMPVLVLITKAREDRGFQGKVQTLMPEARKVLRIRAMEEHFDDGIVLKSMGIDDLLQTTHDFLPESRRMAFVAAQSFSVKQKSARSHESINKKWPLKFSLGDGNKFIPLIMEINAIFGLDYITLDATITQDETESNQTNWNYHDFLPDMVSDAIFFVSIATAVLPAVLGFGNKKPKKMINYHAAAHQYVDSLEKHFITAPKQSLSTQDLLKFISESVQNHTM